MIVWQVIKDCFDLILESYKWLFESLFTRNKENPRAEPFNVLEYSQRREKLILELEKEYQAEHTIVLWWSYDGLKLNKDGTHEWISKKPPDPIKQAIESNLQNQPISLDMALLSLNAAAMVNTLQMQNAVQNLNTAMMYPRYLPSYPYYNGYLGGFGAVGIPYYHNCNYWRY